ncbi:MAG: magnesium transporter [Candidatus Tectomicrobia bacterium]|uniref:Magnesium transporter MgtE n=1 Tax=Tectimicrobiota bacterium TaxID=2528274 RepID=A0A932I3V8_UNCTE|nr:magnesium transporter [Candidatus Tectomicrobia bacterium]
MAHERDLRLSRIEDLIRRLLRRNAHAHLSNALEKMHAAEVAQIFSHLAPEERLAAFRLVPDSEHRAETLTECDPHIVRELLDASSNEEVAALLGKLNNDDTRYLVEMLPEDRAAEVMRILGTRETAVIEGVMAYPPDTAGSIMTDAYVALPESYTVDESIAAVRQASKAEYVFYVYVVDDNKHLRGVISLRQLLLADPSKRLSEVMTPNVWRVSANADQEHVAQLISRYNILAIPVVDDVGTLVGIVTVDDVLDVLRDEATEDILKMAGTHYTEEITSLPALRLAWVRLPWLVISWLGSLIAAYFISRFEHELIRVIALAAFIPVINGTAGNVGAQGVAIMVRGLATGKVTPKDWFQVVGRQVLVGVMLGVSFGLLLYLIAQWQFPGIGRLGFIVGIAICISIMTSAALSSILPLVLQYLRFDPALMTGPFITTSMDLISVLVYFNIARYFLAGS